MTSIGQKLKSARLNRAMTQELVAQKIEVSRQTISNWETGKSYPDIINLIKLSDVYQLSLDSLVKDDRAVIQHLEKARMWLGVTIV